MRTQSRGSQDNGFRRGDSTNGFLFDPDIVQRSGIWDSNDLLSTEECFCCGSKDSRDVVLRKDGLVIKECSRCGFGVPGPRPSPDNSLNTMVTAISTALRISFTAKTIVSSVINRFMTAP